MTTDLTAHHRPFLDVTEAETAVDLGTVVALVPHDGVDVWPVVQFEDHRTAAVSPGLLEVVGEDWPAQDFAAGATKA